jgi:hypothetical protein
MSITCPKCRRVQYFVCANKRCACYKRVPKGKKPQRWLKHDGLACPYCGYTKHADFWIEREMLAVMKSKLAR